LLDVLIHILENYLTIVTFNYPSSVLWDMDGVLADTTELHFQSWQIACSEFGIELKREKFLQFFGCTPSVTINGLVGPETSERRRKEIRIRKEALYREELSKTIYPTPGVLYWLEYFSEHCSQAVASSAPIENIISILDSLNIHHYFQEIISGSEMKGKPDPGIFLYAAKALSALPSNCLIIEDSLSGVTAAKEAGIPVIAICTSHTSDQLHDADLIMPDLSSLTLDDFQSFCQNHY
jgi:HAD superfamily hydrolase (TIGR01509 family)